jgi:hypothetical protein
MLLEHVCANRPGRVAVETRMPAVTRLLQVILKEWHVCTEPGPADQTVALVEHGLSAPVGVRHILWLAPRPFATASRLALPLSLTALYQALQGWFFPAPRRYLRLALDQPAQLELRGVCLAGRLLSLSERGGRVACPVPLPNGELLQLAVQLGEYPLLVAAQVIYTIPAGDLPGSAPPQAGLLFRPLPPVLGEAIHRHVERSLVERACRQVGLASDDPALAWFDTVAAPWAALPG